jgi:phospholipid/cholesterol/gamma-HCH transport system permease protein
MLKELGPVLCGIIIAARSSSSISAEISSLKNNNQIDVLQSLSINPYNFLIIPKILAIVLCSPILLLCMVFIAKYGSYIVLVKFFEFSSYGYIELSLSTFELADLKIGFLKIIVFTFFSSLVACFNGMNTDKGAGGITVSVINTVVSSCLLILFFNFIITLLF